MNVSLAQPVSLTHIEAFMNRSFGRLLRRGRAGSRRDFALLFRMRAVGPLIVLSFLALACSTGCGPTLGMSILPVPVYSPAGGVFASVQRVTISEELPVKATIYYTTDGSTPTTESSVYTGALTVSSTETIRAVATAQDYADSGVATASYTVTVPAATPVFSPVGGSYSAAQNVTIMDATPGAVIHYTTDGTTPTSASPLYSGAFSVAASQTIQAIAVAEGYSSSAVATASYTITLPAATPLFSPGGGTYTASQFVTITDATLGATIYYTTDGTTPTSSSRQFLGVIFVVTNETIKAIAVAPGYGNSAVATATYTISPPAATPVFSPATGAYPSGQTVTIADATPGAVIHYTTDGTTPTSLSPLFSGAITVTASETIQAIAVAAGYANSAVATATYTIASQTATPVFSPPAGTYTSPQTVTITDATQGAVIYYTIDGTTPTSSSPAYSGAITVAATDTINAIAIAPGDTESAVATAAYTIEYLGANLGNWIWMGGSMVANTAPVWGSKGVASAANTPGGRFEPAGAADSSGRLWLFGGVASNPIDNLLSDLWSYDTATQEWTWVGGSSGYDMPGSYGTEGVASPGNAPTPRSGAALWTDPAGNVWLFGGGGQEGTGAVTTGVGLDDLWKFDPKTAEWTWTGGTQNFNDPPVYETQGTPSTTATPGARIGAATCSDGSGNLWSFGGGTIDHLPADGVYDDLWELAPGKAEWTWLSGSQQLDQPGSYGTKGIGAATNNPPSRSNGVCWVDSSGNFWLFGGAGVITVGDEHLNDLWEYSPATKQWTWVRGSDQPNSTGSYGVEGVAAATNDPPSRISMSGTIDSSGNLWMFGGYTEDVPINQEQPINDLWKFNVTTGEWTWEAGSQANDQPADYGTLFVPAPTNTPGAKDYSAMMEGNNGAIWLYGGYGYAMPGSFGIVGEWWMFQP